MELEKPDWLQVPQRAGGEVSRARLSKDVKGKLQAGKGDQEIIGQLALIITRLVLTDSKQGHRGADGHRLHHLRARL
eukprot:9469377-Pyramimonas_sp.AAC.1